MAALSAQARRDRKLAAEKSAAPPLPSGSEAANSEEQQRARAIARKVSQMEKFDDAIDECTAPKDLHLLTASRERIFREWCALTRNPISGTFKTAPIKPTTQRSPFADPT
jgi:hypothetical protein